MTGKVKFEYLGTGIAVNAAGEFVAEVNGDFVKKPSMDAMRRFIKESHDKKFKPFSGLYWQYMGYRKPLKLTRVKVVGVRRVNGRRRYGSTMFLCDGGMTLRSVMVDTPENEAAAKASKSYEAETEKLDKVRIKEQDRLDGTIVNLNAEECKPE